MAEKTPEKTPVKTQDDILFEEIDDELRKDHANKLWQAYGQYVIALCVAIVVGVGGFKLSTIKIEPSHADKDRLTS